jgi:Uma2 family endonuclease
MEVRGNPLASINRNLPSEWQPSLRLLTTSEYEQMIAAGIFNENDRIELLEGVLVEMSPKGMKHATSTDRAARHFIRTLGDRAIVRNQNPIRLNDRSEPEPDLVLALPEEHEYSFRHPEPEDIYLILEVADTTLSYDRNNKGMSYAKSGIIQYLILNLNKMEIEDYREPGLDGYGQKQTYKAGQSFNLIACPDIEVKVSDLLPPTQKSRQVMKGRRSGKAVKLRGRKTKPSF